jgi:NADH-quinone oxidoreductase subunit L
MLEMGGVGKKLPLVKWVFIIGSLSLAGLPILNGFWSKELILESGLKNGPLWLYIVMVLVTGLTALYTIRCVWLVFFGEPRSEYHVHPIGWEMKTALIPLAAAALVSWLAVGRFSVLLGAKSLPYHSIEPFPLKEMIHEVLSIPTLIVLVVIAIAVLFWIFRERIAGVINGLKSIRWAAENSFGFEAINQAVVKVTQSTADALRTTQTGVLGWNVFGILASIIILFVILVLGA